ncbi:unnamed protein product [Auanema sp. JU1783]|nr:unnamed protein product [Auanema sp. JU1783]
MMKLLAFLALAACASALDTEYYCNYTLTGDESFSNAVPINTFRTSGLDLVRPHWCITHCKDRKSVKAEMLVQPANPQAAVFNRRVTFLEGGKRKYEDKLVKGYPGKYDVESDNFFCTDATVAATVDAIVDKYTNIDDMSEALNFYINKPGWAYLIYEMGPPPSLGASVNILQDDNMCVKSISKSVNGAYSTYMVYAGLVQP